LWLTLFKYFFENMSKRPESDPIPTDAEESAQRTQCEAEARHELRPMLQRAPAYVQFANAADGLERDKEQQQRQRRERPSGESLSMRSSSLSSSASLSSLGRFATAPWKTLPQRLRAAAATKRAALGQAWSAAPRFFGHDVPAEVRRRTADGTLWGGRATAGPAADSMNRRRPAGQQAPPPLGRGAAGVVGVR
jgi:hypothetical protein